MPVPAFPDPLPSGSSFFPYPVDVEMDGSPRQVGFENGVVGSAQSRTHPVRRYDLTGENLPEADFDCAMAFARARGFGAQPFTIVDKSKHVTPPYDAPTLDQTAGGALAGRTCYAKFSWSDGTYETVACYEEGSKAVDANKLLTVSVPTFPRGVTQANLYLGLATGIEKRVSKIATSNTTWTEPYTTVNGNSNSGQKVLLVASTTNFQAGDRLIVGYGTARQESCVVDTIQAGTSLTMVDVLQFTHLAVDADDVRIDTLSGAALPASNTLEEAVKVVQRGPLSYAQLGNVWNLTIPLVESLV